MYTKKLSNSVLIVASVWAMLIGVSCQSGNQNTQQQVADSSAMSGVSQDVKDIVNPLPTPFELTQTLKDIGAQYNSKILNLPSNIEKYFKESSKAINLGVYVADLAYAASYDQKQDINIYSKTVKDLVDQLGIKIDYSLMMSDEFKSKVNNKDSLVKIISNTYIETYNFLEEKSNPDYSLMMISGMWIELMYIATNISEDTYNFSGMVNIISNQGKSYKKLMSLLAARNANADIKNLETKLIVLQPVFEKAEQGLTEQDYSIILKTIQNVRKSLVL